MSGSEGAVFDPKKSREQEYRESTEGRAVRPRDASTLIIVRRDSATPQVLMGQRHANHKFMPNKFVFPGGRVDRADSRVKPAEELRDPVARRLLVRMRGKPSGLRARALAMAAIRETFEETGLILGKRIAAPQTSKHPDCTLDFVARAITPPYRTRRFDTRFFIADAEAIEGDPTKVGGSGELQGLHWLTLDDARGLDLPNITRVVLDELGERLALSTVAQRRRAVPFIHFRNGNAIRDAIAD
jgi:8-oxo-dGTP pyrophosphatase MutT (NUDIX family)